MSAKDAVFLSLSRQSVKASLREQTSLVMAGLSDFGWMLVPKDARSVVVVVTDGWELCPGGHSLPVESPSLCLGCDGTGWRRP